MAVVHVALEENFVGSFPAVGQDPILAARQQAVDYGVLEPERAGRVRCLVRDGRTVYRIEPVEGGWRVGSASAGGAQVAINQFAAERTAHDWLLKHLGFGAARA